MRDGHAPGKKCMCVCVCVRGGGLGDIQGKRRFGERGGGGGEG